jgi:hypothetical protein
VCTHLDTICTVRNNSPPQQQQQQQQSVLVRVVLPQRNLQAHPVSGLSCVYTLTEYSYTVRDNLRDVQKAVCTLHSAPTLDTLLGMMCVFLYQYCQAVTNSYRWFNQCTLLSLISYRFCMKALKYKRIRALVVLYCPPPLLYDQILANFLSKSEPKSQWLRLRISFFKAPAPDKFCQNTTLYLSSAFTTVLQWIQFFCCQCAYLNPFEPILPYSHPSIQSPIKRTYLSL